MNDKIEHIIELAKAQFVMDENSCHGLRHWKEVDLNGEMLALQEGVDPVVVHLFAYLHDCKRVEDNGDYEHGDRSAEYVNQLRAEGLLDFLTVVQFVKLSTACLLHAKGGISDDMTIGSCFDADRIELIRVGIVPKIELMSTPMGKRIASRMQKCRYQWIKVK
jgi:uncharacterized protein